jgi:hypothetical protein
MTKSTLNTLWLAGGGLLATWLAVNPNTPALTGLDRAETARTGAVREVTLDDLKLQQMKRREQVGGAALPPSRRNPFRFRMASAPVTPHAAAPAVLPSAPASSPAPSLYLSGIATEGLKRTAIISGQGQLYLVTDGEPVAGRYHVVTVESNAVTLRDDTGADIRLVLH